MRFTFVLLSGLFIASTAVGQSAALNTSVEDHHEKKHTMKSLFGAGPVVIVAGDQMETADEMQKWIDTLRPALKGKAKVVGLVDLDDVPFFVPNGAIRSDLRERYPKGDLILCDWDGEVYQKIGFAEGAVVEVAVFDSAGKRVALVKRGFNAGDRKHILRVVQQAAAPQAAVPK